ncbi:MULTISPECIES: hypothetical protein [unclassified Nocardia]|uniref:hypothetical protein n=1 Tax=unclassified Nocardia TaxID=2637762 RepID=UPI001CE48204|nr:MULTISPECIES: hypothetical protein [unclassified Nocardia]
MVEAQTKIDYGRAEIAAFKQGAASGHIKFDPQVVDDAVKVYDRLISQLTLELNQIQSLIDVTGFGGFPSTQQLAHGFNNKAKDFAGVLTQFIEGAMRLQEAFLIAGGKIAEADAKNAQALQFVSQTTETENPNR